MCCFILDLLVWADDCVICSNSLTGLEKHVQEYDGGAAVCWAELGDRSLQLLRVGKKWAEAETSLNELRCL